MPLPALCCRSVQVNDKTVKARIWGVAALSERLVQSHSMAGGRWCTKAFPRCVIARALCARGNLGKALTLIAHAIVGERHAAPGAALAHWYAVGEGTAGPGAALV